MRLLPLALTLALLLAPGCLEAEDTGDEPTDDELPAEDDLDSNDDGVLDTGEDTDGDGVPEPLPPAPEPLVFTGELKGMGDVSANAPVQCPLQAQQCADHEVTVPAGAWDVTFTLVGTNGMVTSQGVPYETDYDLFVADVGDSANPSGEDDVVASRLKAGTYTAQVLAWHDVDGSYTLTVTFEY